MGILRRLLWVLAVLWWVPAGAQTGVTDAGSALDTATARLRSVPREVVLDGVVEAVKQSTVSAQISGRIEQINFDVDDYVPRGAVLLRFRDKEERARLEQAQATLNEARARFNQAQADYERIKNIYAKKLVSKSELDKATAQLKSARARLESAQARVKEAREQLDHTVVRAPYSGIVVKRFVEVGETASAGQPLMTGLSLEQLRAVVSVPQEYVDAVRRAGKARVFEASPDLGDIPTGKLTIFPYADPDTHTFRVRIELPDVPRGLYPGMMIKAAFDVGQRKRLLVPRQAVTHRSEVTAVYVVDAKGRVHFRQVRAGRNVAPDLTEVLAGLQAGEKVALDPIRAGVVLKQQWAEAGTLHE